MPVAKILKSGPASYAINHPQIGSVRLERGVEAAITREMADYLEDLPDFGDVIRIDRSRDKPLAPVAARRLSDEETYGKLSPIDTGARRAAENAKPKTLADALNLIDIDHDESYEEDGRPSTAALSAVMGRIVSTEERDRAFPEKVRPPGEPAKERTRVIRKRAVEVDATTEGAVEA